ncbi:hypothetical protein AsAng_0011280 [Aureispira anguillae]|uniref:Uncharacterized protein n=1 Tax=Aureispira anguillae TaxID=2864201 RepID=A0A916DR31_9BACT|nr:hypothetical protein AsAng_0011280 [Aureispira anguillae]
MLFFLLLIQPVFCLAVVIVLVAIDIGYVQESTKNTVEFNLEAFVLLRYLL